MKMGTFILIIVGIIIGIVGYKILLRLKKKIAIKNIKQQMLNLRTIIELTPDSNERIKSLELYAKLGEKLKELKKEG